MSVQAPLEIDSVILVQKKMGPCWIHGGVNYFWWIRASHKFLAPDFQWCAREIFSS